MEEKNKEKYVQGKFKGAIPEDWCKSDSSLKVRFRIYSTLSPNENSHKNISEYLSNLKNRPWDDLGIFYRMTLIKEAEFPSVHSYMGTILKGDCFHSPSIMTVANELKLMPGLYCCFMSKQVVLGNDLGENVIRKQMDYWATFVNIIFGGNFLKELLYEALYSPKEDNFTIVSESYRVPSAIEGPYNYFLEENDVGVDEFVKALKNSSKEQKQRFEVAWDLLHEAYFTKSETTAFLNRWIALEIILGKTYAATKSRLIKIYKPIISDPAENMHINRISNIRSELVHKGVKPMASPLKKRLLDCYYLDLSRDILKLEPKYFAVRCLKLADKLEKIESIPLD